MEMHTYRTHTCGELRRDHAGKRVRLSGWIHSVRDHGGILFIDLRDHYGLTQIVINPHLDFHRSVEHWRVETVVCFTGQVVLRSPDSVNPNMATGEAEVVADEMEILGAAAVLPFQVAREEPTAESLRLKYRFLDLRRERLHHNMVLRSEVIAFIRRQLIDGGFYEFQTPILTNSSPEGARDFLVPSRVHPGKFYALPQAPQQFKQLLMISGFDKYFQIAPCFRDEDARADRTPGEFYQLDLEMSFATQGEILEVVERLLIRVFQKFSNKKIARVPFPRIRYKDAMDRYGSDKPDLRNRLQMIDVTDIFAESQFNAFSQMIRQGGVVRAIPVKDIANQPRKFFDDMVAFAQSVGARGLAYIIWSEGKEKSPIVKFLSQKELKAVKERGKIGKEDAVFFIADQEAIACRIGGYLRTELANKLALIDDTAFHFCWVTDFPMYERDELTGRIQFSHNPFSMPQGGMKDLIEKHPLDIVAYQYDIVCNGMELSSGAIRNHDPDMMYTAFEIAGYSKDEVDQKFGAMIRAFAFGAPPHGGIAPGIDRIIMLLAGETNLREVIAFPLNQQAEDLMMGAPAEIRSEQLKELGLKSVKLDT